MFTLKVNVKCPAGDNFAAHRLICLFLESLISADSDSDIASETASTSAPTNNIVVVPGMATATIHPTDSKERWKSELSLPDLRTIDATITLKIFAPDGSAIFEQSLLLDPVKTEVDITASSKRYVDLTAPTKQTDATIKVRGRVIDSIGGTAIGPQQVALFGTQSGKASRILGVTISDSRGYFAIDCPEGPFTSASAKVGDRPLEQLELSKNGTLPTRIILAVPAPTSSNGDKKDDCSCEARVPTLPDAEDIIASPDVYTSDSTGGCVSLNKPNRTIEEFDFFGVVRTTEPEIVGMTLPEPQYISSSQITKFGEITKPRQPVFRPPIKPTPPRPGSSTGQLEAPTGSSPASPTTAPGRPPATPGRPGSAAAVSSKDDPPSKPSGRPTGRADINPMPSATQIDEHPSDARAALNVQMINPKILKALAKEKGYTEETVAEAAQKSQEEQIDNAVARAMHAAASRAELSAGNPLDWDDDPTFYQAATIAHGHILHFKQIWKANGFSLGDLLYSMPLAPGQKRQVAILDWERREIAARTESLELEEALAANLSRDRDINEIINASLKEKQVGVSLALTGSSGSQQGSSGPGSGAASALMLVSGSASGLGGAGSIGFQKGSREATATSLQQIRDQISQSASSVRNQRSTVVQSVAQGETLRAQTEVIANYNHCHAVTVEYFEVLRHFVVDNKLVDVQECLFVPLLMSPFDRDKCLRWRQALQARLLDRKLLPAFDSLNRIVHNYDGADFPAGSFADESITRIEGLMRISFRLVRPADKTVDGVSIFDPVAWAGIVALIGIDAQQFWNTNLTDDAAKDKAFIGLLGKEIAEELLSRLEFRIDNQVLPLQCDLASEFSNKVPLQVRVRSIKGLQPGLTRRSLEDLQIRIRGLKPNTGLEQDLPLGTRATLDLAQLRYSTAHIHHNLVNSGRLSQSLIDSDGVFLSTPISAEELRNPRNEDKERVNALMRHLHDNLEYYHRVIWLAMDPARRYMLLDGIIAPNSNGRSVASVVENRLIGIVGNCMVLPVVPGVKLDPVYQIPSDHPVTLLDAYQPERGTPPLVVSVPTKGVYAEAVMGGCNSCEKKDETRFWRWEESPLPDQPSPIGLLSTDSRRSETPDLSAKDFAAPIINLQNAPAAPDPTGLAAMMQLIGKGDAFRDLTGLSQNQQNAIAALQSAGSGAAAIADQAGKLAAQKEMSRSIDKTVDVIQSAQDKKLLDPESAQELTKSAINTLIGGSSEPRSFSGKQELKDLAQTARDTGTNIEKTTVPGSEAVKITISDPTFAPGAGSGTSIFSLPGDDTTLRSFKDFMVKTDGVIEMNAVVNAPDKASDFQFEWEIKPHPDFPGASGTINPIIVKGYTAEFQAMKPGPVRLECVLITKKGRTIGGVTEKPGDTSDSDVRDMSVPQYVFLDRLDPEYEAFLKMFEPCFKRKALAPTLDTHIHATLKHTFETIIFQSSFGRLNVQICDETDLPAHLKTAAAAGSKFFITAKLMNQTGPSEPVIAKTLIESNVGKDNVHDHEILLFPGNMLLPEATTDVTGPSGVIPAQLDRRSQDAVLTLVEHRNLDSKDIDTIIAMGQILGALLGEALAHEVFHCLIGNKYAGGRYSILADDIMRKGADRSFEERTGFEIDPSVILLTSPVVFPGPGTFSDPVAIFPNTLQSISKMPNQFFTPLK